MGKRARDLWDTGLQAAAAIASKAPDVAKKVADKEITPKEPEKAKDQKSEDKAATRVSRVRRVRRLRRMKK